jgi:hypothetical protein
MSDVPAPQASGVPPRSRRRAFLVALAGLAGAFLAGRLWRGAAPSKSPEPKAEPEQPAPPVASSADLRREWDRAWAQTRMLLSPEQVSALAQLAWDLVPPDVLPISPESLRVLPEAQARATAKEWEEDAEMLAWHRDSLDLLAQIAGGPWEKLSDARRAECLDLFFRAAYGPVDKLPEGASEGDVFALCDYVWALRDGLEEVFWQQPAVVSHLQWRAQKVDGTAKG